MGVDGIWRGSQTVGCGVEFDLSAARPVPSDPPYVVELTYFKAWGGGPSNLGGNYYSEGSFTTRSPHTWEVVEEAAAMLRGGRLPGLAPGADRYHVLVDVPLHPHRVLHLLPAGSR